MPYPTPADRKDLESLVKSNWNDKVATPYKDWDTPQLQSYLKSKGADTKKATDSNKDSLVKQVKGYWTESADTASNSYSSVKDWIFDGYPSFLASLDDLTDITYAAGLIPNSRHSRTRIAFRCLNRVSETP